jgi:hypothetical protein
MINVCVPPQRLRLDANQTQANQILSGLSLKISYPNSFENIENTSDLAITESSLNAFYSSSFESIENTFNLTT